ncbi:MAG: ATP-binding cassette domain-containing protein [Parachlamydiaceae bacterium]|nr:ATP-binding cassette domain-containing protein [Parachlamydiaceae bacterium]
MLLSNLSMRFGGKILFKNVSLQFNPGNHYGLIGANGCGKSTLIKIMTGETIPETGSVIVPKQLKLGSLSQDHYLYEKYTLLDVVLMGRQELWKALEDKNKLLLSEEFGDFECEELVRLENIIEKTGGYQAESEAAELLEGLGIRANRHRHPLELLSGGYKLRVLLAQVLFGKPDILVLDEPTNHLDLDSIKWLEIYLKNFPGTIIVTSHDREFLNGICTHIADVDYGTIKIYKGNYDAYEIQKEANKDQVELTLKKQDKKKADLQEFIDRFGSKATKAKQAQSKAKLVENIEEEMESIQMAPSSRIYPKLNFVPTRNSGIKVIEAKEICKSFGEKNVLNKVSFTIERGERIAIIGPNGIGKSTLLEILTNNEVLDQGSFEWGFAAQVAYFPQNHIREMEANHSLLDWLGQFDSKATDQELRNVLGRVLFSGDTVKQPLSILSGGELARLLLAKMMLLKPNVLIFDEPTNHLDIEAIEELIKALKAYEGTILLVSHNRYFVSEIANRIFEVTNEGVNDFQGTYSEYLEKKEKDYLSAQRVLSQRYSNEQSESKQNASQHIDRKLLKSQISQAKKRLAELEKECNELEVKIAHIDSFLLKEDFYQKHTLDDQREFHEQKSHLEKQHHDALSEWEKVGMELQNYEGNA